MENSSSSSGLHPLPAVSIFSPPGGLLVWLFVIMELLLFGIGIVFFLFDRASAREVFASGQAEMSGGLGAINTAVLLTSGYLVRRSVRLYETEGSRRSARYLWSAAGLGVLFVLLKSFEYQQKLAAGFNMEAGPFFQYYWSLTGFHLVHVVFGLAILMSMAAYLGRGRRFETEDLGLETGATFWHMCDLIWIMIFPIFYIL